MADQKTSLEQPKSPELTLQIAAVFDTSLIHRREGETHFIKKTKSKYEFRALWDQIQWRTALPPEPQPPLEHLCLKLYVVRMICCGE